MWPTLEMNGIDENDVGHTINGNFERRSFMSNLKSAQQAIQSELDHARQGVAFYQERVVALEEALAKLDSIDAPKTSLTSKGIKPKTIRGEKIQKPKIKVSGSPNGKLPSTGGDFWTNLLTTQPQSAPEILSAAVKALGISPSKEQLKKLSQRQTNAFHNLVKAKMISDSGSGRERRFFRAK